MHTYMQVYSQELPLFFKSDNREDLNNYRPISVLPTVARVFERLIYEQLYNYFAENKLLSNEQIMGFQVNTLYCFGSE